MGEEQAAPKPAEAAAAALELTGFVMSAEDAERRAAAAGVATVQDLLPLLIPSARKRAQVPISDFQVGAVGLGASGRVYVGVNLEFRGVPLCHSVHAEQFLVANAAAAGKSARAVAVSVVKIGKGQGHGDIGALRSSTARTVPPISGDGRCHCPFSIAAGSSCLVPIPISASCAHLSLPPSPSYALHHRDLL